MPKRLESTAPNGAEREKFMRDEAPNTAKGGKHKRLDEEEMPLNEDVPI